MKDGGTTVAPFHAAVAQARTHRTPPGSAGPMSTSPRWASAGSICPSPSVPRGRRPDRPLGDRARSRLPGQLLGLRGRRERAADGPSAGRRLPRPRLPHDQGRQPLSRGAVAPGRAVARAFADRPRGPTAAPRGHPARRSRRGLRTRGRDGRSPAAARRRCDHVHRLHGPQGPRHPRSHDPPRPARGLRVRCGSDADQHLRRVVLQLPAAGGAAVPRARHRRAGDEAPGRLAGSWARPA